MNDIWAVVKAAEEQLSSVHTSVPPPIRQRVFVLLCREFLRVRSHPERRRQVEVDEFVQLAMPVACRVMAAQCKHLVAAQRSAMARVHAKYERKIKEYKAAKALSLKKAKAKYRYVYKPMPQTVPA